MKKIIPVLMAITLLTACRKEENKKGNLHITGTVKGLKKGKLYIKEVQDSAAVTLDSIIINGKSDFESYVNIDSPQMLYLVLDRGQTSSVDDNLPFFAEPGEMHIDTKNEGFYAKAKITGSENQKSYEQFLQMKSKFNDTDLALLEKKLNAAKDNNTRVLDSIKEKSDQSLKRRYLFTVNFAVNHGNEEVSPFIALSEIPDININYLDTIQKSMTPKVAQSHYGKMLSKYIAERKKTETKTE